MFRSSYIVVISNFLVQESQVIIFIEDIYKYTKNFKKKKIIRL